MSCFAKIKSPLNGKVVTSTAYYQLTSFFPPAKGKEIYEALTTNTFKTEFGFDWTKKQLGYSPKLNFLGEPTIEQINGHLKLKLTPQEIRAAEQIEEVASLGYLNKGYSNPRAFDNIVNEISLNPKYNFIQSEVLVRDGKYYLSVKPAVTGTKFKPVSKEYLKRVKFPDMVVNNVENFSNATLKELIGNLVKNKELQPFQSKMLERLYNLMSINPNLELAVFDEADNDGDYQRSFYDPKSNTIYIAKTVVSNFDNARFAQELIHEALHAYTISALTNPRTVEELRFRQEMEKYMSEYRTKYPRLQHHYGFKNVEEFVSEYLSNPYFREELQEAESKSKQKNFIGRVIDSIKTFLKQKLGLRDTLFNQVNNSIDEYFDYLENLDDLPDLAGEHELRFNQPYSSSSQTPPTPNISKFKEYIDSTITSSSWKQLSQSLSEIDPRFASIEKIKEKFGNISTTSLSEMMKTSIDYLTNLEDLIDRINKDNRLYASNSEQFTSQELVSAFNHAMNIGSFVLDQMASYENLLLPELIGGFNLTDLEKSPYAKAEFEQERRRQVENFDAVREELVEKIRKLKNESQALIAEGQSSILSPVASELSGVFKDIIKKLQDPNSQLNQEIAFKEEQYQKALANNQVKQAKDLLKDLEQLKMFRDFVPTKNNIETLLREGMKKDFKGANWFTVYLGMANMTGSPIVQIVKQYLDVHLTEAENKSLSYNQRLKTLEKKIEARNKNKGIKWTTSLSNFYKNLTREVEMVYYDENSGVRKVVKQLAYNTQFKEAEFRNDLQELKINLEKAQKDGTEDEIQEAQEKLQKFLDTYATRPYKDEYYEAEELLTDDARQARQEILDLLEDQKSLFEDSEAEEEDRKYRAELRRAYERLGSIFNEDGSEKPKGSKERDIADSIIAYKNKRKSLEAIEFVIPDVVRKRFDIEKETRKKKVRDLDITKQRLATEIADLEALGQDATTQQTQLAEVSQKLDDAKKDLEKWLSANARTEISPEFFELQRSIADKIRNIFVKYGEDPVLSEAYDELFNTVKGYRDQDGIIDGSQIQKGLAAKIKEIETRIENLKEQAEESREISEEDKALLKGLFNQLNSIQVKDTTDYYKNTYKQIANSARTDMLADPAEIKEINELAETLTDQYIESDGFTEDPSLELDDELPVLNHPSEFGTEKHRADLVAAFRNRIIEVRTHNKVKQTDWYKANHITIKKSYVNKKTGKKETKVYERPIYIWNRTIPTNTGYINQENPNFDWSVPRVREELKNKDYNFLAYKQIARPRKTDDNRYTNEAYDRLDDEDKALADEMVELYEDIQRDLPASQRLQGYTVPNRTKFLREGVTDLFRPKYYFNSIVDGFKVFFNPKATGEEVEEDLTSSLLDVDKNARLKNSGRKVQLIKTRFKEPLNVNQVSYLLTDSLADFGKYSAEFSGLRKAMPAIFAAREAAGKTEVSKNDLDMIDNEISRYFYGGESNYSFVGKSQILKNIAVLNKKLFRFTQRRVLQFNFLRLFKNVFNNFLKIVLSKNRYGLTRKELLSAWWKGLRKRSDLLSLELGTNQYSDYALKLMYFRAMPSADPTKMAGSIHQGFMYKYMNLDNFSSQIFGYTEMASTIPIYEALMARTSVPLIIDGQETRIKLDDAYDIIDGILVPKDGIFGLEQNKMRSLIEQRKQIIDTFLSQQGIPNLKNLDFTQQKTLKALVSSVDVKIASLEKLNSIKREKLRNVEQALRDQIHELYTSTQGNYFQKRSRSAYERNTLLSLFMSMRRWTYPLVQTSFGSKRMSLYTGNIEEGFYKTGGKSLVRKMRYLASGERMNLGVSAFEKEKHERIVRDNINAVGLHALAWGMTTLALAAGGGDDDDSVLANLLAFISFTTYDEYMSLHPVIGPANFIYKAQFRKPLSKGQEEGALESFGKTISYAVLGSQVASYDALFDAVFDWKTLTDPLSPYYEQRREGTGGKSEYTPKSTEGLPRIMAALYKVYGIEAGLKPFYDSRRSLQTRLKLTPMLGIKDPLGDYIQVQKRITDLSRNMLERNPKDLDYLLTGQFNKMSKPNKETFIKDLTEWVKLKNQKVMMEQTNPNIAMMKREKELSAYEGVMDTKFLEQVSPLTGVQLIEGTKDVKAELGKELEKLQQQLRMQEFILDYSEGQYQTPE